VDQAGGLVLVLDGLDLLQVELVHRHGLVEVLVEIEVSGEVARPGRLAACGRLPRGRLLVAVATPLPPPSPPLRPLLEALRIVGGRRRGLIGLLVVGEEVAGEALGGRGGLSLVASIALAAGDITGLAGAGRTLGAAGG